MQAAKIFQLFEPVTLRLKKLVKFQSLYLFAFVLMIIFALNDNFGERQKAIVGLIALAAVAIELWPKVISTWESLLGRVLIILSYAVIGNFAVAFATIKLNEIIGVDPSPLFYSISFVTLLMAPIWLLTMTLLVMVGYMVFTQLFLLFKAFLKILRISHWVAPSNINYPVITAITRLILMPLMFTTLVKGIEAYGGEFTGINITRSDSQTSSQTVEKLTDKLENSDEIDPDAVTALVAEIKNAETEKGIKEELEANDMEDSIKDSKSELKSEFKHLIAAFVHNIELFKFSQCVKEEKEHVIFIAENDILVSKPNPKSEFGYDFSVRTCVLKTY